MYCLHGTGKQLYVKLQMHVEKHTTGGPREDTGHAGGTMSHGWLGNAPKELDKVAGEGRVWASLLRLLPRRPRWILQNDYVKAMSPCSCVY